MQQSGLCLILRNNSSRLRIEANTLIEAQFVLASLS